MVINKLSSLPLLACAGAGIVVAQVHGGPFWVGLFGSAPLGWVVSIFWEGTSMMLWWRGERAGLPRLVKWLATGALVAGMAFQSAAPLLERARLASTGGEALGVLATQSRLGFWVSQKALAKYAELAQAGGLPPLALWGLAASTVAVMPLLYLTAVYLLARAGAEWRGGAGAVGAETTQRLQRKPETGNPAGVAAETTTGQTPTAETLVLAKRAQAMVREEMAELRLTQSEVGWRNGRTISKSQMSKLMNYNSERALLWPGEVARLAAALGVKGEG